MALAFVRHCACLLFVLGLGCVGDSHRVVRDQPLPSIPQKQPPSPEAAVILPTLTNAEDSGGSEKWGESYASRRLRCLESMLREVGARLGEDGKVHDRDGREVYVWEEGPEGGCHRPESELTQMAEKRAKALRELRKRYTVIELPWFGGMIC